MVQYAAPPEVIFRRRRLLDAPPSLGMTAEAWLPANAGTTMN
jgi:hypothetical protein